MKPDKFHGVGGSYTVDLKTGERTQTEKPAERHKDGDCTRDSDGNPLNKANDVLEPAFAPPAAGTAPEPARPFRPRTVGAADSDKTTVKGD